MYKKLSFRGIRSLLVIAIEPSLVFMIIKVRIGMIMLILTGFGYFDQWAVCLFLSFMVIWEVLFWP